MQADPERKAKTTDERTPDSRGERRLELIATLLLALAAVATAWASYQAARWHGEQANGGNRRHLHLVRPLRPLSSAGTA